ncbi:MAG: NADH-quinone oxidoreductase subunit C, partial [Planctomycetota bacterium]
MSHADLHTALRDRFGEAVRELYEATDPWVEVAADSVPDLLTFVRDDLGLQHLNDLTAADIAPRPGEEKKFKDEPRFEVIYRLSDLPL